jgi:hypothetical protein
MREAKTKTQMAMALLEQFVRRSEEDVERAHVKFRRFSDALEVMDTTAWWLRV